MWSAVYTANQQNHIALCVHLASSMPCFLSQNTITAWLHFATTTATITELNYACRAQPLASSCTGNMYLVPQLEGRLLLYPVLLNTRCSID